MRFHVLGNPQYQQSQADFECACFASRAHSELAAMALERYGDHGSQISGCVRDHFPEHVKNTLRFLASEVTRYSDLAREHRPKRVRMATINRLAQEVATRDGSGFYGPQPIHS